MLRIAGVLAAVVVALAAIAVAFAHAEPANIKPGDGAVLNQPPAQIQIETTEEMARQAGANDIVVVDANGKQVTTVSATIDNADRKKITVPMPPTLVPGIYTVQWKTLSADDGDPANGTTTFTYDPAKTPFPGTEVLQASVLGSPSAGSPAEAPLRSSGGGTSWILLVAVGIGALAVGGGATYLFVQNRS